MTLHNETVFTLKDKSAEEIKVWLTRVIEAEEDYKEKLKDFNILLLAGCINSKVFRNEGREWTLAWSDLYIFALFILGVIYVSNTDSYASQAMRFRVAMIKRLGLDPQIDVLDLNPICKWINIENISLEKIGILKEEFIKSKDRNALYQFIKIKSRISVLKELADCGLVKTDERIDKLIKYITENIFFTRSI